jgi:NADH:ubiquinone oxidoreductase subunit E
VEVDGVKDVSNIMSIVDEAFESFKDHRPLDSTLISILQDVQNKIGFLPEPALQRVAKHLNVSESRVLSVATFYHQFRLEPKGKHVITICHGTACHVGASSEIYDSLMRHLKIDTHEDTSPDGVFTVQQVRCIGACSLAPIIKIDNDIYGKASYKKIPSILARYRRRE